MTRQPTSGAKSADSAWLDSKDWDPGAFRRLDSGGSNVGKMSAVNWRLQEDF